MILQNFYLQHFLLIEFIFKSLRDTTGSNNKDKDVRRSSS